MKEIDREWGAKAQDKYGKAHRVDGSCYEVVIKYIKVPTFVIKVYSVFLRNKEITLRPG